MARRKKCKTCFRKECGNFRDGSAEVNGPAGKKIHRNNCAAYANEAELDPENCDAFITKEEDELLRIIENRFTSEEKKEEAIIKLKELRRKKKCLRK